MTASTTALTTAVTVRVTWDRNQNCPARIGRTCSPSGLLEEWATPATVVQGCEGNEKAVCVRAQASVGARKHDQCCDRNPDGVHCPTRRPGSTLPLCQAEWNQAVSDKTVLNSWEWQRKYRPGDTDGSAMVPKAPRGMLVVGPGDAQYCASNRARAWSGPLDVRGIEYTFVCE